MDYCAPHGIPHSQFLRWSPLDRQKALAWLVYDRRRCSGCGTHPDEWDEAKGGSEDAYGAEGYRCLGCERLDRIKPPEVAPEGMHKRLVPIPVHKRRKPISLAQAAGGGRGADGPPTA